MSVKPRIHQIQALRALAATLVVAGIWLVARVRALVLSEVVRVREALATALVVAGVRLLARVRVLMLREVA